MSSYVRGYLERFRDSDQAEALHKLARAGMAGNPESEIDTPLSLLLHAIELLNKESLLMTLKQNSENLQSPSQMSDAQKDELRKRLEQLKKHNQ